MFAAVKSCIRPLCPDCVVRLYRLLSGRNGTDEELAHRQLWEDLGKAGSSLGLTGPALFLSFDCDTDADIAAAPELMQWLSSLGIKCSFAVPGEQLARGAQVWASLADAGAEFMNHGGAPHTRWDGEKYTATTFYDAMTREDVAADIRRGDELVRTCVGVAPKGFRAPHFGSFQQPDEVAFMHSLCKELGYTYASTTLPRYAFERGPAFLSQGIVELPVIGSWGNPHTILDSWNYLEDRVNYRLSGEYFTLLKETLDAAKKYKLPLLLCWYADPCHVLGQEPFVQAMELIAGLGIPSYTGSECAALFRARLEGAACAE